MLPSVARLNGEQFGCNVSLPHTIEFQKRDILKVAVLRE